MADKKAQNQKSLEVAIQTLTQVAASPTTPKNIKKNLTDLITSLKAGQDPVTIRAANAISQIDDVTQDEWTYTENLDVEKFARLIVEECMSVCEKMGKSGDGHYCADAIYKRFK